MEAEGVTAFVELGPDGVLSVMGQECVAGDGHVFVPVLRRGRAECESVVAALGQVHVRGVGVDWRAFFAGLGTAASSCPPTPSVISVTGRGLPWARTKGAGVTRWRGSP